MAKMNFKVRLQKLLENEFSILSNDKNQFISGYKSLIDILRIPQLNKHLHGCHDLLFECISQIILTPFNHDFDDEQLSLLLELASNSCVLTMSQNQIIDGWLQNVEERTFEKPDNYTEEEEEEEEDDDDLYEDASESEEEVNTKKNSTRSRENPKHVTFAETTSVSSKKKNSSLTQVVPNPRLGHVAHSRGQCDGHQNQLSETSTRETKQNPKKELDSIRGKGRRTFPCDNNNKDCYNCGKQGHVQYDCPKKSNNTKPISRGNAARVVNRNENERNRSKESSSSSSSTETTLTESDQNRMQYLYNLSSKLLNSSQSNDERTQTFDLFLSSIKKLQDYHKTNLPKILQEKQSMFYSLFCHIAQNDFLFTNEQYLKFYELKDLLIPTKVNCLNKDRSIFCRQRQLTSLTIIEKHFDTTSQIQPIIFDDIQEYLIRSTSPISGSLYDLIKHLFKSVIHIDKQCLDHFTQKILFEMKKEIFSSEQLQELHSYLDIRIKRYERHNQKQIWKERLNLFKNDQLSTVDLNQWIKEFQEILKSDSMDVKPTSTVIVDHAMWYFAVLFMGSSGHLNKEQYENLFNSAAQSLLFNTKQKFYFQFYLDEGHAPIMFKELKQIQVKLEGDDTDKKNTVYEEISKILERSKPEFDQTLPIDDTIPIIDNYVLLRLISLVEVICSDTNTFSNEQCTILLDKFLQQSSIVRPLSNVEQQRLRSYYSRPMSLNELQNICSSNQFDIEDLLSIFKNRTLLTNDEVLDYLTKKICEIFRNQRKFSNDKCHELKSVIEKQIFGKQRYRIVNESFQKHRLNRKLLPLIDPTILNKLLTKILEQDHQAHLEFFTLLEEFSQRTDFDEMTISFEINRCLFSSIILIISERDFSNASNSNFYRQHLKTIFDKQREFFSYFLSEQQHKLILSRLTTSLSNLDLLIESIQTNMNETNYENLIHFIENDLKDKNDLDKLFNFILSTFDNQCLTITQTLQLSNLVIQHAKTFKNLLQFLIDLLQLNIHISPKNLLNIIENNQETDQTMNQIITILKTPNGKYAIADWKKTMIRLVTIWFHRNENNQQLKDLAQQSPLFQTPIFRQQLESCWNHPTDENSVILASAGPKTTDKDDQSTAHRDMFRHLESDDPSTNALVIGKLHSFLVDKQLSKEISLQKFIQALQTVFKNSRKFVQIRLDEWATLIANNRGKIFTNDIQCDQLIINILCARLNLPIDTFTSLLRFIQSKKAHERHDGFQKLILILQNSQIKNENDPWNHLPTISNQLYDIITRVIFDQKYNDNQVRLCLTAAKKTCLLNSEHRQKLNEIS
ncbi:hypothetical protein I4U23_030890 [Adineta vaga]|nr:hypothetical protein I4U23_030890 [Adineta vaga]